MCDYYTIYDGKNVSTSDMLQYSLQNLNTDTQIHCVARCNEDERCSTVTFNSNPSHNPNCFLYNQSFGLNSMIDNNDVQVFIKYCKIYNFYFKQNF
jgi:hypothetical protein